MSTTNIWKTLLQTQPVHCRTKQDYSFEPDTIFHYLSLYYATFIFSSHLVSLVLTKNDLFTYFQYLTMLKNCFSLRFWLTVVKILRSPSFLVSVFPLHILSLVHYSAILLDLFLNQVGLESQMKNTCRVLLKSPQPKTPTELNKPGMLTHLWHVPVDLHQRQVCLSGILMQSSMLDTVKEERILVKSHSSIGSWYLTTSQLPVKFSNELL